MFIMDEHNEYLNSDGTLRDGFIELSLPDMSDLSDIDGRCSQCGDIIFVADMDADMNIVWAHADNDLCDAQSPIR